MRDVVDILAPVVATPWTIASWLTSRQGDTGHTAMELLDQGSLDEVLTAARRSANRMTHQMPLADPPTQPNSLANVPGTMHTAVTPIGAMLEALQHHLASLPIAELRVRRLAAMTIPTEPPEAADLTDPSVVGQLA